MEEKIEGIRCRESKEGSDVTDWCILSYTKCVRMAETRKE